MMLLTTNSNSEGTVAVIKPFLQHLLFVEPHKVPSALPRILFICVENVPVPPTEATLACHPATSSWKLQ